ncbi:PREDICTED: uncharacterized protein LOC109329227 [Lupinus angustifolius]|uniref:uncharacterized protein LOC109329227 n=1 Tax=Lupinus angustifolius TaxID=3871 RepID=UPI00092EF2CB|nr:PREDICTED: uncharacterized protein LOC109329227 [Lupinus angustifolius]
MTNNNEFAMNLPILYGKNFDRWRTQRKAIPGFQEVFEVVLNGYQEIGVNATEAQRSTYKEAKRRDCKALFLIHQCVDSANFEKIDAATTSKEAWEILDKSYEGVAKIKKVKLQTLHKQYELLQMDESETISKYMTKIMSLANHMRSYGEEIKEQTVVEKVLRTLIPKYDHIVVVIEESKNLEDYKVEELQGSLEAHELRLKERNLDKGGEHALQARFNKRSSAQWNKKSKGKMQNNRWKSSEKVSSSRKSEHTMIKKDQCYNCRGYYHFASECKVSKWSRGKEYEAGLAQEGKSNESDDDHCLLMATTRSNQDKVDNVDF